MYKRVFYGLILFSNRLTKLARTENELAVKSLHDVNAASNYVSTDPHSWWEDNSTDAYCFIQYPI